LTHVPDREEQRLYTKAILKIMRTLYGGITSNPRTREALLKQKTKVIGDGGSPRSDEPDSYDYVYNNLLDDVHVLKPIDVCKMCGPKRFQYEYERFLLW
jgi:hypothetical protein